MACCSFEKRNAVAAYAPASMFVAGAWFAFFNGCSSPSSSESSTGADAAASVDAEQDALADTSIVDALTPDVAPDVADSGPDPFAGCSPRPLDAAYAPAGWKVWADYDRCCGFLVPKTPADLPAPNAWRACDTTAPISSGCQQLVVNWQPYPGGVAVSPWIEGWVHDNGTVTFQMSRTTDHGIFRLIADADGPVHQAIFEATGKCTLGTSSLHDGRYVYELTLDPSGYTAAAIAGRTTDFTPTLFLKFNDSIRRDFGAGAPGVLELAVGSGVVLHDWNNPMQTTPVQANLSRWPTFQGNAIFGGEGKLYSWTAIDGAKEFLSFNDYPTREVGNLGTDGTDIVWVEGDGQPDAGIHTSAKIMTAPFTTDPLQLAPRRLRSESPEYFSGPAHYIVGCGYGAALTVHSGKYYLRVVRIADGVSWLLPANQPGWFWSEPIALTCTELFILAGSQVESIARVRLDSLGASIPPD